MEPDQRVAAAIGKARFLIETRAGADAGYWRVQIDTLERLSASHDDTSDQLVDLLRCLHVRRDVELHDAVRVTRSGAEGQAPAGFPLAHEALDGVTHALVARDGEAADALHRALEGMPPDADERITALGILARIGHARSRATFETLTAADLTAAVASRLVRECAMLPDHAGPSPADIWADAERTVGRLKHGYSVWSGKQSP
jgi:hypothetical protein